MTQMTDLASIVGRTIFFLALGLSAFSGYASSEEIEVKVSRTYSSEEAVTGELYIQGSLVGLTTELQSNLASLPDGDYKIVFRIDKSNDELIQAELVHNAAILGFGKCASEAVLCIYLSDEITNQEIVWHKSQLEMMLDGSDATTDLFFSKIEQFAGDDISLEANLSLGTVSDFEYVRVNLDIFVDTFRVDNLIWTLDEKVNGLGDAPIKFEEVSRSTAYVTLQKTSEGLGEVTLYRLPILGGCPIFRVSEEWRVPAGNFNPFVRNNSKRPDYASTCGGTVPKLCLNSTSLGDQCSFYDQCVEKVNSCGNDGYAKGYGLKYCRRFASNTSLSEAGRKWRDATLICLQEELVGSVLFSEKSCHETKKIAFDSHPRCYVQNGSGISICDLTKEDYWEISKIIDFEDIFGEDGLTQFLKTLKLCSVQ
ncbi:hypothetical protein Q5Y75_24600 [Ruegeria sp. 2205SS24-7]|uniref:hypothetical protein n=1 Tax=Ruegeria discodermiae TaxID=3064389 RepID=UPI0027423A88|nr:hypothetical protein [Ruegeria sp. 2205SS24-7]MDP5220372.1 hypothetical protein [Ruegeria sp. 2205SS24-7]